MSPPTSFAHVGYRSPRDLEFTSKIASAIFACSDVAHCFVSQFSSSFLFSLGNREQSMLPGMTHIVQTCYVFKILNLIVSGVAVFMIDFFPWGAWPNKGECHQSVDQPCMVQSINCQVELSAGTSLPVAPRPQNTTRRTTPNLSRSRRLVEAFVSWDGPPNVYHGYEYSTERKGVPLQIA